MNITTDTVAQTYQLLPIESLTAHPNNPRKHSLRQDVVDQIAAQIDGAIDAPHALLVRPLGDGYQIISGHHRVLAAKQAGLSDVPCWIREMPDDEAYMQLVLSNTQSELHPLDEGEHAANSDMDLKAYAAGVGKARQSLQHKVYAYRVLSSVPNVGHDLRGQWLSLAAIHAAPQWLWSALVDRMIEKNLTVAQTRAAVAAVKSADEPPLWMDTESIAIAVVGGTMRVREVDKILQAFNAAEVSDVNLLTHFAFALNQSAPARLSDLQSLIEPVVLAQRKLDDAARAAEIAQQRQQEEAEKRIVRLRENVSLDEWKTLTEEEQSALLVPAAGAGNGFNKQTGDAIEWAQWSWNPVTGCKHDCSYCYARNLALYDKKLQPFYPNGFDPTFRSNALNAPTITKVPKGAADDARFRNVFTCSMADLFGRWVPAEWIKAVLKTVADNPQWNFLFLTKFPQRLREFQIPDNAWMGTTVDLQARVKNAEKAFEHVGGKVRWLSVEPMIEPLRFEHLDRFDWVVIGGASQSGSTPEWKPPYRWIDSLVRQCDDAGIPIYMKSNLGVDNRILELPYDGKVTMDPQVAPDVFHYLGDSSR